MIKFNTLIPELSVSNINKSLDFYLNILFFKLEYKRKEDKFAFLSFEGTQIMLEERNGNWETGDLTYPFGRGINLQIQTNDVEKIYENIKKYGYPIKMEIKENWYRVNDRLKGNKEFLVMDLDGYLLRFAQDLGERST